MSVLTAPPAITLPASKTVTAGTASAVTGVSVSDLNAGTSGAMVLNLSAGNGTLSMTDATGAAVAGSGTGAISVTGTLSQINADLAHLTYTTGRVGSDQIVVDVWDPAGKEATRSLAVTATGTATAAPALQTITIASTTASATISASNIGIIATAGDHVLLITGTGDVVTATGGNETITATKRNIAITTGAGTDKISLGGSGDVVNAGSGHNTIQDYGSSNTLILPAAGKGYDDIFGNVLTNHDLLDFRPMLTGTSWDGKSPVGNYLHVRTVNGTDTVISVSPTGVGGASVDVATLHGSGAVSLSGLLGHAVL